MTAAELFPDLPEPPDPVPARALAGWFIPADRLSGAVARAWWVTDGSGAANLVGIPRQLLPVLRLEVIWGPDSPGVTPADVAPHVASTNRAPFLTLAPRLLVLIGATWPAAGRTRFEFLPDPNRPPYCDFEFVAQAVPGLPLPWVIVREVEGPRFGDA